MPIGLDNQLATAINKLAIAELRVGALLDKMGFKRKPDFEKPTLRRLAEDLDVDYFTLRKCLNAFREAREAHEAPTAQIAEERRDESVVDLYGHLRSLPPPD